MNTAATFCRALENFLSNLETCTGVRFCFRDFAEITRHELSTARYNHTCAYCLFVKSDPRRNEKCFFQDVTLARTLMEKQDAPLLRYCHAGVCEVLVPIRELGSAQLLGIIFCGQARTAKSELITEKQPAVASLPLVTESHLLAVAQVVHQYCRAIASLASALAESRRHSLEPRDVANRAMSLLHTRYREPLDLTTVARAVSLSPSRFAHLLKEVTGHSFTHLLRSVRMGEACQLLMLTDLKIHEIASRVGYNDAAYFHRMFRRLHGLTPLEYRHRHRRA
jgi:AraC-like DNA-binding protein